MATASVLIFSLFFVATTQYVFAYDPNPLQDVCVADLNSTIRVNGFLCKDPRKVRADDFFFAGLNIPRPLTSPAGFTVSTVNVMQVPGLNTLGVSMARIDYAPGGENPPHTHPRATEMLVVLEGTLYVGFVTSNPEKRLISKVLKEGDVFTFPIGLIHFQFNFGKKNAVALAAFNSQNPGVITIADAVFGSNPPITAEILSLAFHSDEKMIRHIQSRF